LITIPNKHIIGEIIHNSRENLVVESEVGVDYGSDTDLAMQAIRNILSNHPDVASSPEAQIGIKKFGDSSIDISYRYWVPTRRYYQSSYDINNRILAEFRDKGITIPFPKRDVTVYRNSG